MADVRPILLHSAASPGSAPSAVREPRRSGLGTAGVAARPGQNMPGGDRGPSPPPGRQLQAPAERSLLVARLLHHVRIILLPQAAHGGTAPAPCRSQARPGPFRALRRLPAAEPRPPGPARRGKARPPPRPEPEQRAPRRRVLSRCSLALQLLGSRFKHFFQESPS